MKDPAILFYTADFLSGTFTMSNEDVGKYIRLLCLQHQKGRLDEKTMKSICNTYVEDVYAKFIKDENGLYYNQRLENEAIRRKEYSESRRQNILSRYRKSKKTNPIKTKRETTYVKHMGTETITITEDVTIIITDLNTTLNTSYKPSTPKTQELITARLKEGHTVADFKTVHRKMAKAWGVDNKMRQYLRPQTLYSNKFESYLNRPDDLRMGVAGAKTMLAGQEWIKEKENAEKT